MIGGRRPLMAASSADRRVRVERPHSPYFRYTGPGQLVARAGGQSPDDPTGPALARGQGHAFGRPLSTDEEIDERLSKKKALAIFSSDAISSSAYATEEILRAPARRHRRGRGAHLLAPDRDRYRRPAGRCRHQLSPDLLRLSHGRRRIRRRAGEPRQARVARRRRGAADRLHPDRRRVDLIGGRADLVRRSRPSTDGASTIGVVAICLIMLGNLRGLRESGNIFADPDLPVRGLRPADDRHRHLPDRRPRRMRVPPAEKSMPRRHDTEARRDPPPPAGLRLGLRRPDRHRSDRQRRAGIQAARAAQRRDDADGHGRILLASSSSASRSSPTRFGSSRSTSRRRRRSSPRSRGIVFGGDSIGFYLFQPFTALILFLAANTCFDAFPRLAAILAPDGFMPAPVLLPRRPAGFSAGIIILALIAMRPDRHLRRRHPRPHPALLGRRLHRLHDQPVRHGPALAPRTKARAGATGSSINAVGALLTGDRGVRRDVGEVRRRRYLVLILIPVLVAIMCSSTASTAPRGASCAVRDDIVFRPPHREERVVVPMPGINRAVVQAVNVGRSIADDVRAVLITDEPEEAEVLRERWERQLPGVPLVIVESPYRALVGPVRGLPRRPRRGLAAGQGGSGHLRRPARVRRPPLVGADPLQPVGQAAPERRCSGGPTRSSSTCRTGGGGPERARPIRARCRRTIRPTEANDRRGGIVPADARGPAAPVHDASVVALNGGPTDARSCGSRPPSRSAKAANAELVARPRRRGRLDAAARRRRRRPARRSQRVLDMAEAIAEAAR